MHFLIKYGKEEIGSSYSYINTIMSSGTITKRISSSPSGMKYIDDENRLQWDKDKKDVLKKVWFNDRGVVEKDGEEEYNDLRDDTFINDDGSMNDYRNRDEEINDERFSSLPIRSRSAAASQRINLPPNEDNTSRSTYLKNAHLRLYADGQRRLQRQQMSQQAFHEESPISSLGTRARRSAPNSAHLRLYADGQRRLQQQVFDDEPSVSSLITHLRLMNEADLDDFICFIIENDLLP